MRFDQPLEVRLVASVDAVPTARHRVSRWLAQARTDRVMNDELALVVTELVTNAVEASPGPDATIEVHGHFDRGPTVVLQVSDHGRGFDLARSLEFPAVRAVRGRGLPIVDALTDDLVVERRGDTTVVEITRNLGVSRR
ncbi:MAG: ATP-binding protein [Acidimicrobiales bacterium]|nr:ATP-binding protein [Acidimicrobiales bacterium]